MNGELGRSDVTIGEEKKKKKKKLQYPGNTA